MRVLALVQPVRPLRLARSGGAPRRRAPARRRARPRACRRCRRGLRRRVPPGRPHRHPLQLRRARELRAGERPGHAQRRRRRAAARRRAHGAHVDAARPTAPRARADRRGPPVAAAVAVLGVEDRRRHDGAVVPPRVRAAGRRRPPVQHLRPRQSTRAVIPTILAQLHAGAKELRLGATAPTPRLQLRRRHRAPASSPSPGATGPLARWSTSARAGRSRSATWCSCSSTSPAPTPRSSPTTSGCARRAARSSACCATTPGPASGRGWAPQVSLEEGLARTSDWVHDHLDQLDTAGYAV